MVKSTQSNSLSEQNCQPETLDQLKHIQNSLLSIHQKMNVSLSQQAKALGYNSSEYLILLDILIHPATNLNQLCERLGMKKSAASKILAKLEESEDIVRHSCPTDRREVRLSIEKPELLDRLCFQSALLETFKHYEQNQCHLSDIEKSLDIVLEMLEKNDS